MTQKTDLTHQVQALAALQARLGFSSQRAMAAALRGVHHATLSRWQNQAHPQPITAHGRLAVAQLLGARHTDEDALDETLRTAGWILTDAEWLEAVRHFNVRSQPAFPRRASDRFVGRAAEITALREALLARGPAAPLLLLVTGVPGAGKSALALRVAGEALIQQRFTGGCFWLRMEGLTAEAAQQEFLAQAATAGVRFDPRSWLRDARALLAGRPALIVLDGVDEPLALDDWLKLAQGSGGRVIVTTQRADLGSEAWPERTWRVALDMLEATEARALLTREVAVRGSEEDAAVARLLAALDGLPLALDLANRNAVVDGSFRLLAAEVADDAFATLTVPPAQSLAATFRAAYRRLGAEAAALFRCLGCWPQPFQTPAVAVVLHQNEPAVSRAARTLARQGLIQGAAGSYTMHRLLQAFALELAHAEDQKQFAAWESRFAEYYLGVTRLAGMAWSQGGEAAALTAWHTSLPHIAAGFRHAIQAGRSDWAVDYLKHTAFYLGMAGRADLVIEWRAGFEGLANGGLSEHSWGCLSMAEIYLWMNEPAEALPWLETARAEALTAGDERLWFQATLTLGQALVAAGRPAEVADLATQAATLRLIDQLPDGDPLLAQAWGLVGLGHQAAGDWLGTQSAFREALAAAEQVSAGRWQIARLSLNLGQACLALGQPQDALNAFEHGLAGMPDDGLDPLLAMLTGESALALALLGRPAEAKARLAAICERVKDDEQLAALVADVQEEFARAEQA